MPDRQEIKCPIWVFEETAICRLLDLLLDKVARGVNPVVTIKKNTAPELFDFSSNTNQYLWSLIEALQKDYFILDITFKHQNSSNERYEDAKVRFNTNKEDMVRVWLDRPRKLSDKTLWVNAVHKYRWASEQEKQALLDNPAYYPNRSAEEVLKALREAKIAMARLPTLRALSASCFWGDSKLLDNRLDYLKAIFPTEAADIQPRKLLVNVYIPDKFFTVVFIENQETFLLLVDYVCITPTMADSKLRNTAFVYCAGFRGSASRIRDEGNTDFSLLSETNTDSRDRFTNWWMNKRTFDIQPFFWGDLDYSGLGILAALQAVFPGIRAWQIGYAPMVDYHRKGVHHPKQSAKKDKQLAPETCSCVYADKVLLPLIRQSEYFLDQEIVEIDDLEGTKPH